MPIRSVINKLGMFKFILQIAIMLSLGAVIYLIARATPRINDEELRVKAAGVREPRFMNFLEKIDARFKIYSEKFLRRVRVWILKLDNSVAQKLHRFKKEASKENAFPLGQTFETEKENSREEST